MEKRIIYFNRSKALTNTFLGIATIIGAFANIHSIFKIPAFFVGGSLIYFGSKSTSEDPQLIISDEGLYVGFKFNKTISWNMIKKVSIKKKSVDFRKIDFIEIMIYVNTNGPSNIMVRDFPLENLTMKPYDIENLINEQLTKKSLA